MKSVTKLIRRFVGILMLSTILLFLVNLTIFLIIGSKQAANSGPWTISSQIAAGLSQTENGIVLSPEMTELLKEEQAWAMYIDNDTLSVLWHTQDLPENIPLQYNIAGIASLTRSYIEGFPTFPSEALNGIVVVGFSQEKYWKHLNPSWDTRLIRNAPWILLSVMGINILILFLIYLITNLKLLNSIQPIADGISALPTKKPVCVKETGLLSDLAAKINRTSELLQYQEYQLREKESARANWISGVSHDIRTPLSMVMGYAGQLETCPELSEENRNKISVIRHQSIRMKNLINDLNLASKLEYQMQPLHPEPLNLISVIRQTLVDFINLNTDERYSVDCSFPEGGNPCSIIGDKALLERALHNLVIRQTLVDFINLNTDERYSVDCSFPEGGNPCSIIGDKALLERALHNLLINASTHNPQGCHILIHLQCTCEAYVITVEDDGIGVTNETLEKLRTAPHYMMSDGSTSEPRHGLGLLIVQQIMTAHHGKVTFDHSPLGGFSVTLAFPSNFSS